MVNKKNSFTPYYEEPVIDPQLPLFFEDYESREYFEKQAELKRRKHSTNIGNFYTALYHCLYGGRLNPSYETDLKTLESGVERDFRPDITYKTNKGECYAEVKAVSRRSTRPQLSVLQIENYSHNLLNRILDFEDKNPWVKFAFFRYGAPSHYKPSKLPYETLIPWLANETNDLLILPLNLTLLLLKTAKKITHNQTSSQSSINERDYWIPFASTMNLLHEDSSAPQKLLLQTKSYQMRPILEELLCINPKLYEQRKRTINKKIECRYFNPETRRYNTIPVNTDFTITEFEINNYEWNKRFSQDYKDIAKLIGFKNHYGVFTPKLVESEEKRRKVI